jgi:uncharacterized membrane protein YgcG
MAVQGPTGTAPSVGIVAKLMTIPLVQKIQGYQSLSPFWGLLTLALGVLSLVLAAVLRSRRGRLLLTGALLLVAGFLPLLLAAAVPIAVIACFMPLSKSRRSPFYQTDTATNLPYMPGSSYPGVGGGGYGGGMSSGGGGFSGGGGASGSF